MATKQGKRQFGSTAGCLGPLQARYTARTVVPTEPPANGQALTSRPRATPPTAIAAAVGDPPQRPAPRPRQGRAGDVREYAEAWLVLAIWRTAPATSRPVAAQHVFPTFGSVAVPDVTPAAVRTWHAALSEHTGQRPARTPTPAAHHHAHRRGDT